MQIDITPQGLITLASVVTAAGLLIERFAKGVRWFDKQDKQTTDIEALKQQHNTDIQAIKNELAKDMHNTNEELTLLTYGILACLKGLREQGCNGPVTRAIDKLERHLNIEAHR